MNTPKPSRSRRIAWTWGHCGPNCSCFSAPIGQHFLGEVRRSVEIGAGEIENERPGHHGHFDDPQPVVVTQHFRNGATANVRDFPLHQPQVHVALPAVVALVFMDLDGRPALFGLAFNHEHATMNSRTEGTAKNQTIPLAVFLRPAKKVRSIAHEHTANQSLRALRGRADSPACERLRSAGVAARPSLRGAERPDRSPCLRRRDRSVDRRAREPLGGASTQWRPGRVPENGYITPCRRPGGAPLQCGHDPKAVEMGQSALPI